MITSVLIALLSMWLITGWTDGLPDMHSSGEPIWKREMHIPFYLNTACVLCSFSLMVGQVQPQGTSGKEPACQCRRR